MPNRVQTLRSSAPGVLPQTGTRLPGELWLNFADYALGFIDTAQTAQKILAVRWFVPTATYATGDFVLYASNLYRAVAPSPPGTFVAANWSKVGTAADLTAMQAYVDTADAARLLLAGGTMTGPLILSGPPTQNLQAATKAYVDSGAFLPVGGGTLTGPLILAADPAVPLGAATAQYADRPRYGDNRIINGGMRIDQRNNGVSGTATSVYTVDRWLYGATQASRGSWQRQLAGAGLQPLGFGYYLQFVSASAYAVLAGDSFSFRQPIEADMVTDFAWGTTGAQPVTLSFLATSTLPGTFGGAISNGAPGTRSYPFSYSIPVANAWTKIAITIPGDSGGTWTLSGNGVGAVVWFDLGSGATFRAPAGAWAAGDYRGANGAVSVVGTNAATFFLTGVKLEIGAVATPFNRQTTAKSMVDCQRYYQVSNLTGVSYQVAGQVFQAGTALLMQMRATPTFAVSANNNNNISSFSLAGNSASIWSIGTATVAGTTSVALTFTASAEL